MDLSQLNHLASLRRLRTLQLNDNPLSNEEKHVDKALEAIPWLIELDNEPIEDRVRKKSIQSIFFKNMEVAGIQYLYEKTTKANKPFLSFKNPKCIEKQWLNNFNNEYNSTNFVIANQWNNTKLEVSNRDIIEIIHGKTELAILWAAIFELHLMAKTNPILKAHLFLTKESNLYSFACLPYHSTIEEIWNCLGFQEIFESQKRSHSWPKETSLRKEFFVLEGKFGLQTMEKGIYFDKEVMAESSNVDQYFSKHLEYEDNNYKDIYKENVEYKKQIEDQLLKIMNLQAIARGMLVRKSHMKMQKLAIEALATRDIQQLSKKHMFESNVLQIQVCVHIAYLNTIISILK